MFFENWLEDLLPTKWSRRLAMATVFLAGSAFAAPSILPASFLPALPEQVFLIRLVLLLLTTTVGSIAVSISVVRAYHAQAAAHQLAIQAMERAHAEASGSKANHDLYKPINYPSLGITR
ncbi:MAG TPA: hypothetical protein VMV78_01310 [Thiobacillus sp.]|nr:hypothetical protein [Thiobacillus sp.]